MARGSGAVGGGAGGAGAGGAGSAGEAAAAGTGSAARTSSSDFLALLAVLGFALFWAAVLGMLFNASSFVDPSGQPSPWPAAMAGMLLMGMACVQCLGFVSPRLLQAFAERKAESCILAIILALPSLMVAVAALASPESSGLFEWPAAFVWLCFGMAAGSLLPRWGEVLSVLDAEQASPLPVSLNIAWSVALSAVFGAATVFLPRGAAPIAGIVMLAGSTALLLYCVRSLPEQVVHGSAVGAANALPGSTANAVESGIPPMPAPATGSVIGSVGTSARGSLGGNAGPASGRPADAGKQGQFSLFSRNLFRPLLLGALWGAFSVPLFLEDVGLPLLGVALAAVAAASLTMAAVLLALKRVPRHSTLERTVSALAAVALALLILDAAASGFGQELRLVLVCLAAGALSLYLISHWSVLVALSYRHTVQPMRHYCQGLLAPAAGAGFGWLLALAAFMLMPSRQDATLLAAVVGLVALVLVASLAPSTANDAVETVFEEPDGAPSEERGRWQRRLAELSEQCRLSPRECEVLALLAKGRNAEHVSKTLSISTHTAKTHIYRIYRKLGVNTQQELIDEFDAAQAGQRGQL